MLTVLWITLAVLLTALALMLWEILRDCDHHPR